MSIEIYIFDICARTDQNGIPIDRRVDGGLDGRVISRDLDGRGEDQGREEQQRQKLMADAMAVEEAGAFAVVLECIPSDLAAEITQSITIPTIGIGAGRDCDGQVLVYHDVLGLFERFTPRFVKQYLNLAPMIKEAMEQYKKEVEEGTFPGPDHVFKMSQDEADKI